MALPRRRQYYYHRLRSLISVISVICFTLLIFFGLLSFLAPSPVDSDIHIHRNGRHVNQQRPSFNIVADEVVRAPMFHVPSGAGKLDRSTWSSRNYKFFYGCSNASRKFKSADAITHPNRYLLIATSGGLNQQRTGITDAVVAARILNATLVVPKLDQKSFWKDTSNFSEIFDVNWFISFLSKDVKIVNSLPRKGGKVWTTHSMRVPRKCNERCYHNRVLPVLLKRHAIQLNKFDYRLSNKLDTDFQKLRCRVNYHALKFTDPILEMGKKLVSQMRKRSNHFIALHLRFEPDMLAFSGCYYGGGEKEKHELGAIRKRWKTLHISNPDKERRHGKCPLTPKEVGLMLRALGYGSDVHLYVASGEVYGGEETLRQLKALFPNFYTKETLASKEELKPFSSFSSRMAALDFIVCDESDVFVTNNNGNMAKILAGRRRYFGHKPTIRPNGKKLYRLFLNQDNTTWEEFASKVRTYQKGFIGEPKEIRAGRGEFHENPSTCICEDSNAIAQKNEGSRKTGKGFAKSGKDDITIDDIPETADADEDDMPDWPDNTEGEEDEGSVNGTTDYDDESTNAEDPELEVEELLSD